MMIETKLFEIRDRATFIPGIACRIAPTGGIADLYLQIRAGFDPHCGPLVMLGRLDGEGAFTFDPYSFGGHARTMPLALQYVQEHWDELESGALIDIEFILKETAAPKVSERITDPV